MSTRGESHPLTFIQGHSGLYMYFHFAGHIKVKFYMEPSWFGEQKFVQVMQNFLWNKKAKMMTLSCYSRAKSLERRLAQRLGLQSQWWWVASSARASSTLAYGRAGACCACSRCGIGGLFFFISSILSSFSKVSSLGRRLDILKYCGLGRYNPAVGVSYYRRHAC